jgi:hypothetical protein
MVLTWASTLVIPYLLLYVACCNTGGRTHIIMGKKYIFTIIDIRQICKITKISLYTIILRKKFPPQYLYSLVKQKFNTSTTPTSLIL